MYFGIGSPFPSGIQQAERYQRPIVRFRIARGFPSKWLQVGSSEDQAFHSRLRPESERHLYKGIADTIGQLFRHLRSGLIQLEDRMIPAVAGRRGMIP